MANKKTEIERLIREDYGFPVLQELLAEIIYETRKYNKDGLDERYTTLLQVLLGEPKKSIKKAGYKNDDDLLARAAIMTQCFKTTDKKTGKRRFLNESEACWEIARLVLIKGYKFQSGTPSQMDEYGYQEVKSTKKRLLSKLEGNVNFYANKHKGDVTEDMLYEDNILNEVQLVRSLFPNWENKYLRQVTFLKK